MAEEEEEVGFQKPGMLWQHQVKVHQDYPLLAYHQSIGNLITGIPILFVVLVDWLIDWLSYLLRLQVLDFDFKKFCPIFLSSFNVYACLVCCKHYQGTGLNSHVYSSNHCENHQLSCGHHCGHKVAYKEDPRPCHFFNSLCYNACCSAHGPEMPFSLPISS